MQFNASKDKQVVLNGLTADTVEHAVNTVKNFLIAFNIKPINSIIEENIGVLFMEDRSRIVITQDIKIDTKELIALVQKDDEKNKIVCSTIKKSNRRATKGPDATRRRFSEIGGKFKEKTITGKAGWQFAPEREDDLRSILADAGIELQNVYVKKTLL
jgi:uncharacterized protein with GYD domain